MKYTLVPRRRAKLSSTTMWTKNFELVFYAVL